MRGINTNTVLVPIQTHTHTHIRLNTVLGLLTCNKAKLLHTEYLTYCILNLKWIQKGEKRIYVLSLYYSYSFLHVLLSACCFQWCLDKIR